MTEAPALPGLPRRLILRPDRATSELRYLCEQLGVTWTWERHQVGNTAVTVQPVEGDVLVDCLLDVELPAGVRRVTAFEIRLLVEELRAAHQAGLKVNPETCLHTQFVISGEVVRFAPSNDVPADDGFMFQAWVICSACGTRFRHLGFPAGISMRHPAVSLDGTEIRVPIKPLDPAGYGWPLRVAAMASLPGGMVGNVCLTDPKEELFLQDGTTGLLTGQTHPQDPNRLAIHLDAPGAAGPVVYVPRECLRLVALGAEFRGEQLATEPVPASGVELRSSIVPVSSGDQRAALAGEILQQARRTAQEIAATHDFTGPDGACTRCSLPRTDIRVRRPCAGAPQRIVPTEADRARARQEHVFAAEYDRDQYPLGPPCQRCEIVQGDARAEAPCPGSRSAALAGLLQMLRQAAPVEPGRAEVPLEDRVIEGCFGPTDADLIRQGEADAAASARKP